MRALLLGGAVGAGLVLAACEPRIEVKTDGEAAIVRGGHGDLKTIARLTCPERENKLRRVSAAADGSSCAYAGEDGTELRLQLVKTAGRPADAVLSPFRAELDRLLPIKLTPPPPPDAPPAPGAEDAGERTEVRMPGLSVDADDHGAQIRIGDAISIDADDRESVVHVRSDNERIDIRAGDQDDSAVIDARGGEDGEVRATYIRATDAPGPAGWRAVSYEARGPAAGPIVVAVLKTKARRHNDAFDAMKDLVRKNVG